jgi:hypothetical protein
MSELDAIREPRTKAGRALLDEAQQESGEGMPWLRAKIVAIEAEVVLAAIDAQPVGLECREWARDVVRSVPAVHILNTDAVPTFKRRPDQCIDRAAVLLALEHAALASEPQP